MDRAVELLINGKKRQVTADPATSLLEVIRNDLGLTGAKYGCGEGQCGACTVQIQGVPTRSCITPISECAGRAITTIEGLENNGKLHPLQEAFLDIDATQCGYCAPGMIMAAHAFLKAHPDPTEDQIRDGLDGNICRCCTYPRIIAAVQRAAKTMREGA